MATLDPQNPQTKVWHMQSNRILLQGFHRLRVLLVSYPSPSYVLESPETSARAGESFKRNAASGWCLRAPLNDVQAVRGLFVFFARYKLLQSDGSRVCCRETNIWGGQSEGLNLASGLEVQAIYWDCVILQNT
jgi:hypothetical protein